MGRNCSILVRKFFLQICCFTLVACTHSENEIQSIELKSIELNYMFSDTIYSENTILIFKNGNLVKIDILDEYRNKYQRIELNTKSGSFNLYNLVENDESYDVYYDYLEVSLKDGCDSVTSSYCWSYLFDKLRFNRNTNTGNFYYDFIRTNGNHDLFTIHIIGDEKLLASHSSSENRGKFTFDYSNEKFITVLFKPIIFSRDTSGEFKYYTYPIIRAYSVRNYNSRTEVKRLLPMNISDELEKEIDEFDFQEVKKLW